MASSNEIIGGSNGDPRQKPTNKKIVVDTLRMSFLLPYYSERWMTLILTFDTEILPNHTVLPADIIDSLFDMTKDEKAPILYRGASSFFLSKINLKHASKRVHRNKNLYLEEALKFCESPVSERERRITLKQVDMRKSDTSGTLQTEQVTVGGELYKLKEMISEEVETNKKFREDPEKWMREKSKGSGIQDGFIEDMIKQVMHPEAILDTIEATKKHPEINSATIEEIKNLPERRDVAMLIMRSEKFKDSKMDREIFPVGDLYRVLSIDNKRLEYCVANNKKKYSAFKQITMLFVEDDATKKKEHDLILGVFAKACFKPYIGISSAEPQDTPYRPGKVFLENKNEAKNPRVKRTLEMMGCSFVEILPPELAKIVDDNKGKICEESAKNWLGNDPIHGKDACPTTNALLNNLVCMNCGKADMNIMQCPCKKAFFCSQECNVAMWPKHKFEHKRIMKKLAKKEGKKSKRK